ncbi:ADP-heptose:LPS heptosyltransferase [Chitinivorax tropicus]|uniref:ADP-heptose:LPS heptosyltransferase n=1 Tax=Chitinivorax tropicus TaxID=714531 RepID=A0A840MF77_9PROT|nr:glycosyltransferase family 9 protein [Chitinivorax tropicus]MBB5017050.1 ADP-heptose:LPS heptosyltransferase [Chitinivorax tropicus]
MEASDTLRILIIRRDNIGDLVCTTPMIASLRARFPAAQIDALVNSYNVAVLAHNPHLNSVFAYTKGKHRAEGEYVLTNLWRRFALYVRLLRNRYDYVILAGNGFTGRAAGMAKRLLPKHIIGFTPDGLPTAAIDLPQKVPTAAQHCVQLMAPLTVPLGVEKPAERLTLVPNPDQVRIARQQLNAHASYRAGMKLIGLHISARKPSQRWPAERFIALARHLYQHQRCGIMLFWSPGDEHNPLHPGDDGKAAAIINALSGLPLFPCPTETLPELIGSMALPDEVICSDGGAMHIAAGLGKPIVCFFGLSDAQVWHPWGVPFEILQPPSKEVADLTLEEVVAAYGRLMARVGQPDTQQVE